MNILGLISQLIGIKTLRLTDVIASKLDQCLMISTVQLHVILDDLLPKKGKKKKKSCPRFTVLGRWTLQSGADGFCSFLCLLIQNIM